MIDNFTSEIITFCSRLYTGRITNDNCTPHILTKQPKKHLPNAMAHDIHDLCNYCTCLPLHTAVLFFEVKYFFFRLMLAFSVPPLLMCLISLIEYGHVITIASRAEDRWFKTGLAILSFSKYFTEFNISKP